MKLGIDLHGVIDTNPRLYKIILETMGKRMEVHIISGPPRSEIIEELEELGFKKGLHYEEVHSIVDFLKENGEEMYQDENGRWWTDNDDHWCATKANICDEFQIDAMIDDKEMYRDASSHVMLNMVYGQLKKKLSLFQELSSTITFSSKNTTMTVQLLLLHSQ